MGAGNSIYKKGTRPDTEPESSSKPTFDPNYGFSTPREVREPKMTNEEMRAVKIPPENRDYCADFLTEWKMCKRDNKPFTILCKSEMHNYVQCEWDDYIHRKKEFERERRLRLRQKKIEGMSAAA